MRNIVVSSLRILQLFFTLLSTALIGNVVATNVNANGVSEAAVNFALFVIVLSWIAAIWGLLALFVSAADIPIVSLSLDTAATLFTFIASVVLSAKLTAVNCGSWGDKAGDWIAFGSDNDEKRCREIQASIVFLWIVFAAFAASLFFVFKEFRRGGGSMGGPSMSQIGV